MSSAELQPHELMQMVANFLESHHIAYRVAGMMKLQGRKLDRDYISDWAGKLGVADDWTMVRERVDRLDSDER